MLFRDFCFFFLNVDFALTSPTCEMICTYNCIKHICRTLNYIKIIIISPGINLTNCPLAAQENNYRTSVPNDNNYSNTIAQASNSYHSDHPSLSQTENGLLSIDIAQHVVIPKQLNNSNLNNEPIRCASVKSRSSVSRRISAAELEHLMLRQSSSTSVPLPSEPYLPPSLYNESGPNPGNGPKKYTSVAEMKRRTQQRNSAQSPIIDQQEPTCSANLNDLTNNNNELQSTRSRSVLRWLFDICLCYIIYFRIL